MNRYHWLYMLGGWIVGSAEKDAEALEKALRFAGYDEFCCDECDADDLLN